MRATGSGLVRRIWSVVGDCSTVGSPGLTRWSIGELEYWIPHPITPTLHYSNLLFLLLPRLPDLQDPFLRFLLARAEFWIGVGKAVLYAWTAPLVWNDFAERDVITQR